MKFDLQKFSEDIKMYRCNKGFSRAEFAKHLGVESQEFIFLFESGKRAPSKDLFDNYCKITGRKGLVITFSKEFPEDFLLDKLVF